MFVLIYTTRIILNALGASDYGVYSIVGGAIGMMGFLSSAMATATQRYLSYYEGAGNASMKAQIFNVSFILHLFLSAIVGVLLIGAGFIFFNGVLNIPEDRRFAAIVIYGCLIASTVFTVMSVPYDATINSHENMRYYSIVGILASFLKLIVAYITVHSSQDKLIVYGILMAIIPYITLTIMRIYCHKHYEECHLSIRKHWDKKVAKSLFSFAGWNFVHSSSVMIANYGLGVVVNMFMGVLLNSALSIAQQLDGQLKVFSNTMLKAVNPVIMKTEGSGNTPHMLRVTETSTKMSFFLFAFFMIPFIIETPYILKIWLKNVPEWCVVFCRCQLIVSLFGQLGASLNSAVIGHGKIKLFSIGTAILYLSSIGMSYLLYSIGFPPYAMYIPVLILNVILYRLLAVTILHKYCQLSISEYFRNVIARCLLVAIIGWLSSILLLFFNESFVRLVATVILSSVLIALSTYLLGMNHEERSIMKSTIPLRFKNGFHFHDKN